MISLAHLEFIGRLALICYYLYSSLYLPIGLSFDLRMIFICFGEVAHGQMRRRERETEGR